MLRGAAAWAAAIAVAAAALAAPAPDASRRPNYAIPNICAILMCTAVLAVACRRFRRT
jgi:hypothetical protein